MVRETGFEPARGYSPVGLPDVPSPPFDINMA